MESNQIKILAIDDNKDNLVSISALINDAFPEAQVLSALNGKKGLELAVAETPDVILLDIIMPVMDGFDVCKKLKADQTLRDIPVVFVTALKSDKENRIKALEYGAEAFLAKPIDKSELTAQIQAMVKIKTANFEKHHEKERLAALVDEQTVQLKEIHLATLNLLYDLRKENEARKKSEDALRESEQRYRLLIETAGEGIFVAQGDRLKFLNPTTMELTGRTHQELMSLPFIEFVYPDDRDLILNNYQNRLKDKHVDNKYHFRLSKPDNSIKWVEMSGVKIEWEGEPATMNFISDITERKLAENRNNLSSKILNLFNNAPPLADTIKLILNLIQDKTGFDAIGLRLKKGNDFPYFSQIGFSDEFISTENKLVDCINGKVYGSKNGNYPFECTCGLVISGQTDSTNPLFTEGGSFWTNNSPELLDLTADEDPRHNPRKSCIQEGFLSIALIPIRANGEIVGLLQFNDRKKDCFTLDQIQYFEGIGEIIGVALMRKQAEEALEQSHNLLLRLSEQVPGVIYQYRLYPDGRSCVPYSSPGMNEIYEVSSEEVREDATPVFGRLHPDDLARVSELIFESARTLQHFYCEYRVVLPKQGLRWRYSDALPERTEDGGTLWHGIIYDITQRKKMETLQIHADRMANLGEMAAGIAHEINQPLNNISMALDNIIFETEKTETFNIESFKIKSERIFENIGRMKNIIDHIRAFSRSDSDYLLSSFDINSSIGNAVTMLVDQFKHLGITINLQLDKNIPQIIGNTHKFEQVIINLLVNAKDALIEKKNKQEEYFEMIIGISSIKKNKSIIVEVTDNGFGISNEHINNIILPFYTTKGEGKGTGLGLSICYQIIKEMNGTIDISSKNLMGTKIKIVLDTQL